LRVKLDDGVDKFLEKEKREKKMNIIGFYLVFFIFFVFDRVCHLFTKIKTFETSAAPYSKTPFTFLDFPASDDFDLERFMHIGDYENAEEPVKAE
jgi:hypothetical protein